LAGVPLDHLPPHNFVVLSEEVRCGGVQGGYFNCWRVYRLTICRRTILLCWAKKCSAAGYKAVISIVGERTA